MKRYILLAMLLATTSFVHATERPTVAILPFGIAKDRNSLKWLSFATASTLTETLRRIPSVRPLPFANVIQELRGAGIDPHQATWTPAVATEPLGQWLKADRVLLGAIGKKSDHKIANVILQAQTPPTPAKGTQIWLAARVMDISSGQSLGSAYVEGHTENIQNLQQKLLMQLASALNIDTHLPALQHMPEPSFKVYQYTAEAEQHLLQLSTVTTEKQQSRAQKRAIKAVEHALRRNPESAIAHTLQGTLYGIQNRPKSAAQAFETAIEKDPLYRTPRYGLVDLALQQEDLPQAAAMLESITQIAPYDDDAFHLQGTVYRLLNQPDQALSAYENALKAYKKRPETLYEAGLIYLSQNQTRKAILSLQQAVEQIPGELIYQIVLANAHLSAQETARARVILERIAAVSESDPEYQLVSGKFEHQIGQYDNALIHYKKALQALPNRAELHAAMGKTYGAQKRFTDAINAFIAAQSHGIKLAQIALPFGNALEAKNQMPEAEDLYQQTLNQAPNRADIRLRLIKHQLNRNATKEATKTLQEGVRLHPNRGDFHLLLADLYAAQKENPLAILHYQKALELGVSPTEVAAQLGQLYLSQNQPDQAKTYFEQAHHAGAMGANIYAGLGTAEEQLGNLRAARSAFQQALKANPQHQQAQQAVARLSKALRPKRQAPKAQDYATRALQAISRGDIETAQNAYEKALSMSPNRSNWWRDLGTLYIQQGQTDRAETAFQNAIQHAPHAPEHHYNLSKLYTDLGWVYDAESASREALNIDPNYLPAQQQLGTIYLIQGEYQRAKSTFENIINKDAQNLNAQLSLGNAQAALGHWAAAEAAYTAAQEMGAAATIGLGNLQLAQGDTIQAIFFYEHAIEQDPKDPTPHVNLGLIHASNNQFEKALSAYQNALNLSPNDSDILTNLIALYTSAEQYNDALELCRTLEEIVPNAIQPKQLTGAVAYAASQFELALIAYQNALDLNPKNIEVLQGIASTYEALDNPKAAQEHWQTWLNLVGDDPAYSEAAAQVTEHLKALAILSVGTGQGLFP